MVQKTIGQVLKETRTRQDLTLDAAEQLSKIKKLYISALESGNYDILPGPFYVRAYMKQYASKLGLDVDEILGAYDNGSLLEELDEDNPLSNTGNYRFIKPSERVQKKEEVAEVKKGLRQYFPILILGGLAALILVSVFGIVIANSLHQGEKNLDQTDYSLPRKTTSSQKEPDVSTSSSLPSSSTATTSATSQSSSSQPVEGASGQISPPTQTP